MSEKSFEHIIYYLQVATFALTPRTICVVLMACHITHTPRRHINLLACCCWPAGRAHTHTNQMGSCHLKCPVVSLRGGWGDSASPSRLSQQGNKFQATSMAQHSIHNFMVFPFVLCLCAAVGELGKAWEIGKSVVASVAKFAYFPPARSLCQPVSQSARQCTIIQRSIGVALHIMNRC